MNAAHIFHGTGVHLVGCRHVLFHKVTVTHHISDKEHAGQETDREKYAHPPVHIERQWNSHDRHKNSRRQIRDQVRHTGMCQCRIVVNDLSNTPGFIFVIEGEGRTHQVPDPLLLQVCLQPEGQNMRGPEREKVRDHIGDEEYDDAHRQRNGALHIRINNHFLQEMIEIIITGDGKCCGHEGEDNPAEGKPEAFRDVGF